MASWSRVGMESSCAYPNTSGCAGVGGGFIPGLSVPVQGVRSSARLAAAGPNPFSAAGMTLLSCEILTLGLNTWQLCWLVLLKGDAQT